MFTNQDVRRRKTSHSRSQKNRLPNTACVSICSSSARPVAPLSSPFRRSAAPAAFTAARVTSGTVVPTRPGEKGGAARRASAPSNASTGAREGLPPESALSLGEPTIAWREYELPPAPAGMLRCSGWYGESRSAEGGLRDSGA